ncbi:MAG: ATP-binding protein [Promethearchaeota archaeon]
MFQQNINEILAKLKPVLGERRANSLWLAYQLETNLEKRRELEGLIHTLAAKHLDETFEKKKILLQPPPELKGEFNLGKIFYGDQPCGEFKLKENSLLSHIGIFGMTGAGKTNVVTLFILNLLKQKKTFLVFDWKRNYRDLLALPEVKDLIVYTVGRDISPFYWNPLIPPPQTEPSTWLKQFIIVCQHALFLGHGVERILQKVLDSLYLDYGLYKGNPDSYPTLKDVEESLQNYKSRGREAQWLDSARRAIGALCFGGIGKVLNVSQNIEVDLTRNVIFELDSLTDSEKTFFTEAFLLWIYHKRLSELQREVFKHCTIIEEAHNCLLREKMRLAGKETITDIILRQIRELGEALIIIDQQPSLITTTALSNIHTHIMMKMSYPDDVNTSVRLLSLEPCEAEYLRMLKTGSAITKIPQWHKPFLIKFPLFAIKKGSVSDEDVKNKMRPYLTKSSLEEAEDNLNEVIRDFHTVDKKEKTKEKLTLKEKQLLVDILNHPTSGTVERYHRLGLNAYRGTKLRQRLLEKDLIKIENIATSNGRLKVFDLREKGKEHLRELGCQVQDNRPKNASLQHEYWKKKVAHYFRDRGYKVTEEQSIGEGKSIDLVLAIDEEKIGIEIETGKSDAISNIRKDLEAGLDR